MGCTPFQGGTSETLPWETCAIFLQLGISPQTRLARSPLLSPGTTGHGLRFVCTCSALFASVASGTQEQPSLAGFTSAEIRQA